MDMFNQYDVCPNCGDNNVSFIDSVIQSEKVIVKLHCHSCNYYWYEVFIFSHNEFTEYHKGQEA
jgi:transcription elongation factor Elf1